MMKQGQNSVLLKAEIKYICPQKKHKKLWELQCLGELRRNSLRQYTSREQPRQQNSSAAPRSAVQVWPISHEIFLYQKKKREKAAFSFKGNLIKLEIRSLLWILHTAYNKRLLTAKIPNSSRNLCPLSNTSRTFALITPPLTQGAQTPSDFRGTTTSNVPLSNISLQILFNTGSLHTLKRSGNEGGFLWLEFHPRVKAETIQERNGRHWFSNRFIHIAKRTPEGGGGKGWVLISLTYRH